MTRLYEQAEGETEADESTLEFGDISEDDIKHLKDLTSEVAVIRLVN